MKFIRRLWFGGADRRKHSAYAFGVLSIGIVVAVLFFSKAPEVALEESAFARNPVPETKMAPAGGSGEREPEAQETDDEPGMTREADYGMASVFAFLNRIAEELDGARGLNEVLELLEELDEFLAKSGSDSVAPALVAFLDSGRDASTGLPFTVRPDGFLDAAPALRVILLDELEKLSPGSAAEYAVTILDESMASDEWAIALRSLGRGRPPSEVAADDYFNSKVEELLYNEVWLDDPTVGFLQAFDVIVYQGGGRFVPRLAEMLGNEASPAVQYGVGLALDRLVMEDFAGVMQELQAMDSFSWRGQEAHRARLFARADVRDSRQRLLVENYLQDPGVSAEELGIFAQTFPYFDVDVSNNLLTSQPLDPFSVLLEKDRAALEIVRDWREDSRFRFQPEAIAGMEKRLEEFVASGERGLE